MIVSPEAGDGYRQETRGGRNFHLLCRLNVRSSSRRLNLPKPINAGGNEVKYIRSPLYIATGQSGYRGRLGLIRIGNEKHKGSGQISDRAERDDSEEMARSPPARRTRSKTNDGNLQGQ